MLKNVILFFLWKDKKITTEEKPELKIHHSVVPTQFEQQFPHWDKHLYNNIKSI